MSPFVDNVFQKNKIWLKTNIFDKESHYSHGLDAPYIY